MAQLHSAYDQETEYRTSGHPSKSKKMSSLCSFLLVISLCAQEPSAGASQLFVLLE